MSGTTAAATPGASAAAHPLKVRDFRLFWIGSTISLFGDQFYFVALPWLVLQLTGSGLALGTILMVAATPRAVFMLLGGAASDRFSARRVLIATASARTLLVMAIAALIYLRVCRLWHLYVLAFAFGFADAFAFPAAQALIPSLVGVAQLPAANSLIGGSVQLSTIAGPAPAGLTVKRWGSAAAFIIDAVSFLFVIAALIAIPDPPAAPQARKGMWHSIAEGLGYVAKDPPMRSLMLLIAALNFGVAGPLMVGLATLAKQRFASATALGTFLSALGAGALIGTLLPSVIKHQRRRGLFLLAFSAVVAAGMTLIGILRHIVPIVAVLGIMGLGSGYVNINLVAWLQGRVDRALVGRVMSVLSFCALGLIPFSYGLAGALAQFNLSVMFVASSALVLVMTVVAAMNATVRAID